MSGIFSHEKQQYICSLLWFHYGILWNSARSKSVYEDDCPNSDVVDKAH